MKQFCGTEVYFPIAVGVLSAKGHEMIIEPAVVVDAFSGPNRAWMVDVGSFVEGDSFDFVNIVQNTVGST